MDALDRWYNNRGVGCGWLPIFSVSDAPAENLYDNGRSKAPKKMSTPPQPPSPANATPSKPYINTRSAHNVNLWVNLAVTEGRIKNCCNLDIAKIDAKIDVKEEGEKGEWAGESFFVPTCRYQSFELPFVPIDDDTQLAFLRRNLHTNPVSCPKNCTYYKNRRWGRVRSMTGSLYEIARELLKGFAGLSLASSSCFHLLASPLYFAKMGTSNHLIGKGDLG